MLEINKNYLLDQNQKPIAVQIPIAEFEKIEEILENYQAIKLMEESENDPNISKKQALEYLESLKNKPVIRKQFTTDKLEQYRQCIKKVLTEYHEWISGAGNFDEESCLIFDEIHDQYLWIFMGWKDGKKTQNIHVHIRIVNEKIYIEEDWTEEGMAIELMREGLTNHDIVLAFHPPDLRKHTEFAIG
jgi:hypothetical protein